CGEHLAFRSWHVHRIRSVRQRPASNTQSSCPGSSVAACLAISPVSRTPNAPSCRYYPRHG
ncbi:MAG: hypothetical protein AVDCRST_MAG87-882, partial [uncultured Thermomicrobiales bacterium]